MGASDPMGRLDSVPQTTIDGLMALDASKLGALAKKKAELLALADKSEELLALLDPETEPEGGE